MRPGFWMRDPVYTYAERIAQARRRAYVRDALITVALYGGAVALVFSVMWVR